MLSDRNAPGAGRDVEGESLPLRSTPVSQERLYLVVCLGKAGKRITAN